MENFLKRTWAEIDLDAVDGNFRAIKAQLKPQTLVCCVIKADAYGHGAEKLALEYESLGADWFAVSNLEEALQLRRAGAKLPILILGYTPACMARTLAENNISQAVVGPEFAAELSGEAVKEGVKVHAHFVLDTGMSRIGFFYQDAERDAASLDELEQACRLPGLEAEGVFTHFAVADEGEKGRAYTLKQYENFTGAIGLMEKRGVHFKIRHCANSASIFDYPQFQLDMARPGIILYGLMPSSDVRNQVPLKPVMTLKSTVALVKTVAPQTSISYGRRFTSEEPVRVATVPIGYADGYLRRFYEKACVLIRGKRAKILGRVCMDQMMVDVTDIPEVMAGDPVTVMGKDGSETVSADELAALAGSINYEIVCDISKRVPRVYYKNGTQCGVLDYLKRT